MAVSNVLKTFLHSIYSSDVFSWHSEQNRNRNSAHKKGVNDLGPRFNGLFDSECLSNCILCHISYLRSNFLITTSCPGTKHNWKL